MLIPEETHRQMVKILGGGDRAHTETGTAYCIFDNAYASAALGGMELADRSPQLTMTTCDAERLGLSTRGRVVEVVPQCGEPKRYRIRNPEPDGTGMSTIILDAEQ